MDSIQIKVLNNGLLMAKLVAECMNTACSFMDINSRQLKLEDQSINETTDYYDELELGHKGALFLTELCEYLVKQPLRLVDPEDLFPEDIALEATYSALGWLEAPKWLVDDVKAHVLTIIKNNNHVYLLSGSGVDSSGQQINRLLATSGPVNVDEAAAYSDASAPTASQLVIDSIPTQEVVLQPVNLELQKDSVIIDTLTPLTTKRLDLKAIMDLPRIDIPRHKAKT